MFPPLADPTGLFESWEAAISHLWNSDLSGTVYNTGDGYQIHFLNSGKTLEMINGSLVEGALVTSSYGGGGSSSENGSPSFTTALSFGLGIGELSRQWASYVHYGASAGHVEHALKNGKYIHRGQVYWQGNYPKVTQAMKNSLSGGKFMESLGQKLTITSALVTVVDGSIKGWKNHHTADLVVTGALYILAASNPLGWIVGGVYTIADLAVQAHTGKSITENLFD
jgi:hypothetical protein